MLKASQNYDSWKKIRDALEKAGKTDCWYYKEAVVITDTVKSTSGSGTMVLNETPNADAKI